MAGGGRRGPLRGHRARGRPVDGGWRPDVERLVGALFVVFATAAIAARLLSALMTCRWPGGVGLERAGHALVGPVLPGSSRGEALMADTERNPPHRELAQAAEGRGVYIRRYLERTYGRGRWRKMKAIATVRLTDGTICEAEIHWFEAHGIGRKDFKIKRIIR
jgi:hypothetical protein